EHPHHTHSPLPLPRPPGPTLFPYTTLFRSLARPPLLPEPLDPSGRVHHLLLTREERVADRTDLDVDALQRAPRLERIPTRALNRRDLVVGMDPLLHGRPPSRKKGSPQRAWNLCKITNSTASIKLPRAVGRAMARTGYPAPPSAPPATPPPPAAPRAAPPRSRPSRPSGRTASPRPSCTPWRPGSPARTAASPRTSGPAGPRTSRFPCSPPGPRRPAARWRAAPGGRDAATAPSSGRTTHRARTTR